MGNLFGRRRADAETGAGTPYGLTYHPPWARLEQPPENMCEVIPRLDASAVVTAPRRLVTEAFRAVTADPRLAVMVLSSAVIRAVLLASSALMREVSAAVLAAAVAVRVDMAAFVATSREFPSTVIWLAMAVTVAVIPEVTSSSWAATSARSSAWNSVWATFMATRPNTKQNERKQWAPKITTKNQKPYKACMVLDLLL